MENNNLISGISLNKDNEKGVYICYVEELSEELKEKIKEVFPGLRSGSVFSNENEIYNLKNTLKRFLEMYSFNKNGSAKSDNIKKGIIGELISHILIPEILPHLKMISVMRNKEENSMKKGFDSIYFDESNIWYCEVKAGGDENYEEDIDEKNKGLLGKAKTDLKNDVFGDRDTLWYSAVIDVEATISDNQSKIKIKELLHQDHPDSEYRNMNRNVIMSSVLYKNLESKICLNNLTNYKTGIDGEEIFSSLIVFSTQKPTYTKIENFLIEESNKLND